jgi:hypothetical protein
MPDAFPLLRRDGDGPGLIAWIFILFPSSSLENFVGGEKPRRISSTTRSVT